METFYLSIHTHMHAHTHRVTDDIIQHQHGNVSTKVFLILKCSVSTNLVLLILKMWIIWEVIKWIFYIRIKYRQFNLPLDLFFRLLYMLLTIRITYIHTISAKFILCEFFILGEKTCRYYIKIIPFMKFWDFIWEVRTPTLYGPQQQQIS